MRVLFTAVAVTSHVHPLIPVARALIDAGHEVAVASAEEVRPIVEHAGLRFVPVGIGFGRALAEAGPPPADDPAALAPFWGGREAFGRVLPAHAIPDLLALCRRWRPDLIVRETLECAGCLVAEALGLPHASVEVGTFFDAPFLARFLGDRLDRHRAALGLPPDPAMAMPYRHLHLSCVPPSYQDPARPLPLTAHALRTVVFDRSGEEALPAWVDDLPAQPTVYATLGTVYNDAPDLFRAIVAGLRDLPLNLIVTVGRDGDPALLGPQPANVRIERYVPQSLLLPRCAAVVCHGGWNTILAALAEGLPLVLLPLGADQPWNAARAAALGAGISLEAEERSPAAIRAATRAVLDDPSYRNNAARLRAEMEALPGPERAVELLEDLVARRQRPLAATA